MRLGINDCILIKAELHLRIKKIVKVNEPGYHGDAFFNLQITKSIFIAANLLSRLSIIMM